MTVLGGSNNGRAELSALFLCTRPCRGICRECGARAARRVGEEESSLLDCIRPHKQSVRPVLSDKTG